MGVAGSEAGTYIGLTSNLRIDLDEVEYQDRRRFGGWGFQKFPSTETTNLAMRKMYLTKDPFDIFIWSQQANRSNWPEQYRDFKFHPHETFPRCLMQEYVKWRRSLVDSDLVNYNPVNAEAVRVYVESDHVGVRMADGSIIESDRLIMASGSIAVKVPDYLKHLSGNQKIIFDPLDLDGHQARMAIHPDASVLVLGTGLTGEEQIAVLHKNGHRGRMNLFSRGGQRHFRYEQNQSNKELILASPPAFLMSETPEEFNEELSVFFASYLSKGHSPEDIFAAIRPFWNDVRADLGGCKKAAQRLRDFRRTLATHSIGCPHGVCEIIEKTLADETLEIINGNINSVEDVGDQLEVKFEDRTERYDFIINAVGRNIIRHEIWENMIKDGLAKKHAGIGIRVGETGRLVNEKGEESDRIWVVGMARAGDHALRHGFLGNTAFNVPQVRSHLYDTIDDLLSTL